MAWVSCTAPQKQELSLFGCINLVSVGPITSACIASSYVTIPRKGQGIQPLHALKLQIQHLTLN